MTKTEIYYIYYKYILGFLSKNLVTAKEANFERNVSISFLLVINKSLHGVLKKVQIIWILDIYILHDWHQSFLVNSIEKSIYFWLW